MSKFVFKILTENFKNIYLKTKKLDKKNYPLVAPMKSVSDCEI